MGGYGMIEYRIRRGDTLPKLSAKFGVPVCMIVRANEKVFHEKAFRIGSTVKIPEIDFCSRTDKNGCFARESDTIYSLAERLGTSMHALMQENGMREPSELRAGMWIRSAKKTDGFVHTVRAGENIFTIAEKYHMTIQEIMEENRITGDVYPGMQLHIPKRKS